MFLFQPTGSIETMARITTFLALLLALLVATADANPKDHKVAGIYFGFAFARSSHSLTLI